MVNKKQDKKTLLFYKVAFGLTTPYNVILDPTLVKQCIIQKINVRDQLPKSLHDTAVPVTTKCIINVLRLNDQLGAAVLARRFKIIPCSHKKVTTLDEKQIDKEQPDLDQNDNKESEDRNYVHPAECIKQLLGGVYFN